MAISERLLAKLKNPTLATGRAPVAGKWLGCDDAAYIAQKDWAKRMGTERAAVLRKLHDLLFANADILSADGSHRCHNRYADCPRRDIRPGCPALSLRDGRVGRHPCQ